MKKILGVLFMCFLFCSACNLFHKTAKYGCPSDGRNVDAGKLAAGDPKSIKAAKNAPKYKATKDLTGN